MIAITFHAFTGADFWIGVGVLAATYGILALGLQLNVGTTGITNFGQAGFMAIGAYTMALLIVKAHWSPWIALPVATLVTMASGLIVGIPALRLPPHYLAMASLGAVDQVAQGIAVASMKVRPSLPQFGPVSDKPDPAGPSRTQPDSAGDQIRDVDKDLPKICLQPAIRVGLANDGFLVAPTRLVDQPEDGDALMSAIEKPLQ